MYKVGDKVVYPHHGAGTVVKREQRDVLGEKREYLTIKILHNDMTVNVPADNAERVGLRKVIDEEAVKKVVKYLTSGGTEMPKNWNRRFKHNRDKMKTGDIFELAEVVRNLSLRDGEKGLSTGEKQMYVKAKKILASELMYAKNLSRGRRVRLARGRAHRARARSPSPRSARPQRRSLRRQAEDSSRGVGGDSTARCLGRPASGPCSSPQGAASGSAEDGRRRSRDSAGSRCSPSRCGGSTTASGSRRSSSSRRPSWEEPTILLAEEIGATKVTACVPGGDTRSASVRAGLAEVPDDAAVILVHDAARPILPPELVAAPPRGARRGLRRRRSRRCRSPTP